MPVRQSKRLSFMRGIVEKVFLIFFPTIFNIALRENETRITLSYLAKRENSFLKKSWFMV